MPSARFLSISKTDKRFPVREGPDSLTSTSIGSSSITASSNFCEIGAFATRAFFEMGPFSLVALRFVDLDDVELEGFGGNVS